MAQADVQVTLNVQTQDGDEHQVVAAERLWLNGLFFGNNVPIGSYQDTSFITEADDTDPIQVQNVEFVDPTHALISEISFPYYGEAVYGEDFYGSISQAQQQLVALPIPTAKCQFHIVITSAIPITISSSKFYAYDGIVDTTPYRGITFKAAQGLISNSWVSANGSSQALVCQNQALNTLHEFYIAVSASPTTTGEKTGKLKFVFTYSQS